MTVVFFSYQGKITIADVPGNSTRWPDTSKNEDWPLAFRVRVVYGLLHVTASIMDNVVLTESPLNTIVVPFANTHFEIMLQIKPIQIQHQGNRIEMTTYDIYNSNYNSSTNITSTKTKVS